MKLDLKQMQKKTAEQVRVDEVPDAIKYVAGFEITFKEGMAICGVAVIDIEKMEIVEKKTAEIKPQMNYIPGMVAFREGPIIIQMYYDLEYDPDVIMVDGQGINDAEKAGLACFVGVELEKPVIGVSKTIPEDVKGDMVIVDGEVRGKLVKTKEHANSVVVSPGHKINLEKSEELVRSLIVPPHKMPEPLHVARRMAKKSLKK